MEENTKQTRGELITNIMNEKYGDDTMEHDEEYETFLQGLSLRQLKSVADKLFND